MPKFKVTKVIHVISEDAFFSWTYEIQASSLQRATEMACGMGLTCSMMMADSITVEQVS